MKFSKKVIGITALLTMVGSSLVLGTELEERDRLILEVQENIEQQTLGNSSQGSFYIYTENEDGNTVTITGYQGTQNSVEIPNELGGKIVTDIGESAFEGCSGLNSIILPSGLKGIGTNAFSRCDSLNSISIPNGLTTIGRSAFSYCNSLETIDIPGGVTSIGLLAFEGCSNLTSINVNSENLFYTSVDGVLYSKDKTSIICFPAGRNNTSYTIEDTVTNIENRAFEGCNKLVSISVPNGVTKIGPYAFADCSSLSTISLPSELINIDGYAFKGCSSLTEIAIPSGVKSIAMGAFSDCTSLSSIVIPNGVVTIDAYTFSGCSSLTEITIPSGVERIATNAFLNCNSLRTIDIPSTVTNIEVSVFEGCSNLTSINVNSENLSYTSVEGVLHSKDKTSIILFPAGKNNTSYTIEDTVTQIYAYAFRDCVGLSSIKIPSQVNSIGWGAFQNCSSLSKIEFQSDSKLNSIGRYAFDGCSSLSSIELPSGLTNIGEYAFFECDGLCNIVLPSGAKIIDKYAFYKCSNLENIEIPSAVTSIGEYAFGQCTKLKSINVDSESNSYTSVDGVLYSKDKTRIIRYPAGKEGTEYIIEETVTAIMYDVFGECSSLKSIEIPIGVTIMTGRIFDGCKNLTIKCYEDSQAHKYAINLSIPYTLIVPVTGVNLNKTSTTLEKGKEETLTATVTPNDATNKAVTWASSDEKIATVDAKGKVTAIGAGTCNITVTTVDGKKTATCAVTVIVPVTGVNLNKTSTTLEKGKEETLTETITPNDATNKAVTWASSDEKVATVDAKGKVTAVGVGNCDITVTTVDGKKTATCAVTVIVPVTGVNLNKTSTTLEKGKEETLTATVTPNDATDKGVTWASSDEKVATVDAKGKVTAVGAGKCNIIVTTVDGKKTATCSVTVSEPIKENPYIIDEENKIISKIKDKTTVDEFIKTVNGKVTKDGKELTGDELVGTGCKIKTEEGKEYTLVVRGDVDGNGKIGVGDLEKMKRHIVGLKKLNEIQILAGDIKEDEKINTTDIIRIKRVIVGLITL